MADQTILSWNMTNWVTIVVMAFLGFLLVAAGAQFWRQYQSKKTGA